MQRKGHKELTANEINSLASDASICLFRCQPVPELRLDFVSSSAKNILGFDPDEITDPSFHWIEHVHPNDRHLVEREAGKVLSTGKADFTYRFKTGDDSYITIRENLMLQNGDDHQAKTVIGMAMLVNTPTVDNPDYDTIPLNGSHGNDRLDNQRELELLKIALSKINDMIIITQASPERPLDSEIIYVNESFEQFTGYPFSEVWGKSPVFLHGPETDPEILERINKKILNHKPIREEFINYKKSGEKFWVELDMVPFRSYNDSKLYWVGINRDITERKKAQQKLEETARKYQTLVNLSFDAIFEETTDGRVLDCNDSACKMFGYSREELIGKRIQDLVPEEFAETLTDEITQEWTTGNEAPERVNKRKDGTLFPTEINTRLIEVEGEKRVIAYVRDISERKKKNEALIRSQKSLADAQRIAHIGNWNWDIQENELYLSDQACTILGVDKDTFSPTFNKFFSFLPAEEVSRLRKAVDRAFVHGEPIDIQHEIIRLDGEKRIVHEKGEVVFNDNNNPVHMNGTIQDITDQHFVEKELAKLSLVASKTLNGVLITDADGKIDWVNKGFEKITGYSKQEAIGQYHDILLEGRETDNVVGERIKEQRKSGESFTEELLNYHKDGTPYWVRLDISPIFDEAGELNGSIVIYSDITERKKYEEQLRASLHEKEILLQEIHHRVKNNLAIITGLLELESYNYPEGQIRQILKDSQLRIHSIAMIHEKLYKSENLSQIRIYNYITELTSYIERSFINSFCNINIHTDIDDIVMNVNQAIPCGLLLNELVNNACKHAFPSREVGHIHICMAEDQNTISLEVRDDGVGLPETFNIEEVQSLGMNLIHTLVKQLEGELDINGDDGSTFRITFERSDKAGIGNALLK